MGGSNGITMTQIFCYIFSECSTTVFILSNFGTGKYKLQLYENVTHVKHCMCNEVLIFRCSFLTRSLLKKNIELK